MISMCNWLSLIVRPRITRKTTGPVTLTEGDARSLLCVASGNPKPLITWYRDNVKVQEDPNNSTYMITSANKNHTGTYKCEAVVTAPGLGPYRTDYTVAVIVRCKWNCSLSTVPLFCLEFVKIASVDRLVELIALCFSQYLTICLFCYVCV